MPLLRPINRSRPVAVPTSVSAPIGGWNTRDSLDGMPPTDATILDNWFPDVGKVSVRKGISEHATGVGAGDVDTLVEHHVGATQKLLACSSTNIYDATSTGAASSLASGFTNGRWDTESFNGLTIFVNGDDTPQKYDGSAVSDMSWSGSGLTPSDLSGVNAFKARLFFWTGVDQDFWYATIDSISGTLTKFSLSRIGHFGGNLISMGTWTQDGGDGLDDLAVFIMSSGEVIVYAGGDPGDATDWALVGIYRIGIPLHKRAILKTGGDLIISTADDYVSLSAVLRTGQVGNASKLSGAITDAAASVAPLSFGYQSTLYRKGNMMLFNVPKTDGTFDQHVINTLTGAPCRFVGLDANCWGIFDGDLYFGSSGGIVYQSDTGNTDDGSAINADGRQAWNAFQDPRRKRLTAARPVISSQGEINYEFGVGFDYVDANLVAASATAAAGSAWDTSPWDTSPWSANTTVSTVWRVAFGAGQVLSPRIRVSGKQEISWHRTDFRLEMGQNL